MLCCIYLLTPLDELIDTLISLCIYMYMYGEGVVQMMNRPDSCMCSSDRISRFYALGNDSALDIILYRDNHSSSSSSSLTGGRNQYVLHSKHAQAGYSSAFEDVVAGNYPNQQKNFISAW